MTTTAEDLARAALQGFFDDPNGFGDMQGSPQRRKAIREVERLLAKTQPPVEVSLTALGPKPEEDAGIHVEETGK